MMRKSMLKKGIGKGLAGMAMAVLMAGTIGGSAEAVVIVDGGGSSSYSGGSRSYSSGYTNNGGWASGTNQWNTSTTIVGNVSPNTGHNYYISPGCSSGCYYPQNNGTNTEIVIPSSTTSGPVVVVQNNTGGCGSSCYTPTPSTPTVTSSTVSFSASSSATIGGASYSSAAGAYATTAGQSSVTINFSSSLSSSPAGYAGNAGFTSAVITVDGASVETESISGTSSSKSYTYNLPMTDNTTKRVCRTVSYSPTSGTTYSNGNWTSGGGTGSSEACVYVKTPAAQDISFSSTSTARINGTNYTVQTTPWQANTKGQSVTIDFGHSLSSSPAGYVNNASYSTIVTTEKNMLTGVTKNLESKSVSGTSVSSSYTYTTPDEPGQLLQICQTISYSPTTAVYHPVSGVVDTKRGSGTSAACVFVASRDAQDDFTPDSRLDN